MPRPRIAWIALALACGCGGRTRTTEATTDTGPWPHAVATVRYEPAGVRSSAHGASHWVAAEVVHTLSFARDTDADTVTIFLAQMFDDDSDTFAALRDASYTLRFASDGHALGVSTDDGASWRAVDLGAVDDPFDEPLWCVHTAVASLDPWPSARALALEILVEADHARAAAVHREPAGMIWPGVRATADHWQRELRAATRYACASEDAALLAAAIEAYVQPGNGSYATHAGDDSAVARCIADVARRDPAVLARLREARARLAPAHAGDDASDVGRIEQALWLVEHP